MTCNEGISYYKMWITWSIPTTRSQRSRVTSAMSNQESSHNTFSGKNRKLASLAARCLQNMSDDQKLEPIWSWTVAIQPHKQENSVHVYSSCEASHAISMAYARMHSWPMFFSWLISFSKQRKVVNSIKIWVTSYSDNILQNSRHQITPKYVACCS